jgi:hypothetical protein
LESLGIKILNVKPKRQLNQRYQLVGADLVTRSPRFKSSQATYENRGIRETVTPCLLPDDRYPNNIPNIFFDNKSRSLAGVSCLLLEGRTSVTLCFGSVTAPTDSSGHSHVICIIMTPSERTVAVELPLPGELRGTCSNRKA